MATKKRSVTRRSAARRSVTRKPAARRSVKQTVGSRAQVMNKTALKTPGGLTRKDLKYNKQGRIVSKKKSARAKRENRLVKSGYVTKKGEFGSTFVGEKKPRSKKKGGESLFSFF